MLNRRLKKHFMFSVGMLFSIGMPQLSNMGRLSVRGNLSTFTVRTHLKSMLKVHSQPLKLIQKVGRALRV